MTAPVRLSTACACFALSALAGCGGEDTTRCTTAAQVDVTASGASPASVDACAGGSVVFTNVGATDVQIASAPHPTHTDCPELNQAAPLAPQGQFTTTMTTLGTCAYHDHLTATSLGRIVVVKPGGGGGGGGGGY